MSSSSSPFGASGNDSSFGPSGNDSPFGASGNSGSPFGASGNESPFGASGSNDSPFGASGVENSFGSTSNTSSGNHPNPFGGSAPAAPAPADPFAFGAGFGDAAPAHVVANPFGAAPAPAAAADPFAIGNDVPSHVVPNPFGAAPAQDPFAIGNDVGQAPSHVVPNPFGAAAAAPPAPANDPFAIGNDVDASHVVANPFGAAPAANDPFAIGNDADAVAPPAHMVANPFGVGPFGARAAEAAQQAPPDANNNGGGFLGGFGAMVANMNPFGGAGAGANPFGIANAGPAGNGGPDELDISQHSVGEIFLGGHMTRIAQQTSMLLSEEERRWTKELKAAVEASQDIKEMTDMDVAQQALVQQGNVYNALVSIKALQEFRKTYEIDDTPEQGLQCLQALFDQQEGMFLDIEINPQTQEVSLVVDVRQFRPTRALQIVEGKPAEHSWQVLVRGFYYLNRATQPSLASARHGIFLVVDCDGVGWDNFNSEVDQRMHAELIQHLPVNWKKTMAYSTAMVSNIWWGLTKRLWSDGFRSALEMGCRLVDTDPSRPPRRISEMYRQPDLETVRQKMERQAVDMLNTRETNDETFTLAAAASS